MQDNKKDKTVVKRYAKMHLYLTLQLLAPKLLSKSCRLGLPNYVELISKCGPQRGSTDHITLHRLNQVQTKPHTKPTNLERIPDRL
jgi:hypothetical protein